MGCDAIEWAARNAIMAGQYRAGLYHWPEASYGSQSAVVACPPASPDLLPNADTLERNTDFSEHRSLFFLSTLYNNTVSCNTVELYDCTVPCAQTARW